MTVLAASPVHSCTYALASRRQNTTASAAQGIKIFPQEAKVTTNEAYKKEIEAEKERE